MITIFISLLLSQNLTFTPTSPQAGEGFLVEFKGSKFLNYAVCFENKCIKPIRKEKTLFAIFGLPIQTKGEKIIKIKKYFFGIKIGEVEKRIKILPRKYKIYKLSKWEESIRDKEKIIKFQKQKFLEKVNTFSFEKFWEGDFLKPVKGKITSPFGIKRVGRKYSYFHKGIDIKAKKGTPILASNSGKIILSGHFNVYGNLIVIDHGFGIISCYFHLNKIYKHEGEFVRKGEVIGTCGDSGWATGSHLHFGIYINGVSVDPLWWLKFSEEISKKF